MQSTLERTGSTPAESILDQALQFCAQKTHLGDTAAVAERLRQGHDGVCSYCLYSIACQVAAYLGAQDGNIKAVYTLDYDATPEDLCFNLGRPGTPLIQLIVWAERKTAALDSLAGALDRALARAYARLIDPPDVPYPQHTTANERHLLDVHVIDDADVERRSGYGALLAAVHQRPIQVWGDTQ
jgi:hypothetical protein